MKNILTIFRRDMAAYFTAPLGYIFMIVFLVIGVGLFITPFFTFPMADMRSFFGNLPILLSVFIPAITMRVWAEDRKENTWELLLTFPMRARDLVLGKFLTTLAFFALTVAATFTIPLMLIVLGNPDNGALIGGYLGTLLLGAFYLSVGIFISGFCKDQIVAFVLSLLTCFAFFLLGTTFIASYIDGVLPGFGSLLGNLVGVIEHYNAFTRGVIEVGDVLYFLVWTCLFLWLNIMYIDGRSRPHVRVTMTTSVILSVGIGLLFNWLVAGQSIYRKDLTEDQIYTVSEASGRILSKADVPVQVKLFITPKSSMPTGMTQLEQQITDKLDELSIAADGKLEYTTVHMNAATLLADQTLFGAEEEEEEDSEDEADAIEKRMLDKGIQPFSVQAIGETEMTNKLIYSSILIAYKDQPEEVIPEMVPQRLQELEYKVVNAVYKLTRDRKPKVAVVAPRDAMDPRMRQMMMQMGQAVPPEQDNYKTLGALLEYEKYDVERVALTKESPLPEEYDTLVVVNPRQLNDRQKWEINRALVSGKSVILAVQNYNWDYQLAGKGWSVNSRPVNPEINDLLEAYGLGVDDGVLMDVNHFPLNIGGGDVLSSLLSMGRPIDLPTHIQLMEESMNQDVSITNRLAQVFYLWGAALTMDEEQLKKHNLDAQVLMSTSDQGWVRPESEFRTLKTAFFSTPNGEDAFLEPEGGLKKYPLMAMVTGQFPDAYKDELRPVWPKPQPQPGMPPPPQDDAPEAPAAPAEPAPGKLILVGCSEMFHDNFFQTPGHMDLFMNAVDALSAGDDLVNVRGGKPIARQISKPSTAAIRMWRIINYALMSTIIAVVGIVVAVMRKRSRDAYTMGFVAKNNG
jgi:ABC-type transport system involved in multi-copper enzyme maturation permease subunit/ABC-type uncharacterized transport system involved in gliding motility auxiliary subunit